MTLNMFKTFRINTDYDQLLGANQDLGKWGRGLGFQKVCVCGGGECVVCVCVCRCGCVCVCVRVASSALTAPPPPHPTPRSAPEQSKYRVGGMSTE